MSYLKREARERHAAGIPFKEIAAGLQISEVRVEELCRLTEKERFQDTKAWPLWPRLPIKKPRQVGMPDVGFIVASDVEAGEKITLYRGNIFLNSEAHKASKFENLDALLAAGWLGD